MLLSSGSYNNDGSMKTPEPEVSHSVLPHLPLVVPRSRNESTELSAK